jgi:hypothetical protein
MAILTRVDKAVNWFERLDSPVVKTLILVFLFFAVCFFGRAIIHIINR